MTRFSIQQLVCLGNRYESGVDGDSRSGIPEWNHQYGLELAGDLGVPLIARAKSRQFVALNADNLVYDAVPGEKPRILHTKKA